MAVRFRLPSDTLVDNNGKPLDGGNLYFYETGTSTALDTFSDDTLSTANSNPIVLDSSGRQTDIFLKAQDYKVVLKDAAGATIKTMDPVHGKYTVTGGDMWSRPVTSKVSSLPVSPSDGDRVLLDHSNSDHPDAVAEYLSGTWNYSDPAKTNQIINIAGEAYKFSGTAWAYSMLRSGTGAVARAQSQINQLIAATPYDYGFVNGGDSATANFQAMLAAEDTIFLPAGNYELDGSIKITRTGQRIHGPGALKFVSGVANDYALRVQASGCILSGFSIKNPNLLGSQTGAATFALYNEESGNTFLNLYTEDWEQGIATSAAGEYYDNIYAFCRGRVYGQGDGPDDDTSSYGEDRGDFITDWGGRAKIIGCIAQAKAGRDCRTGIFQEALDTYASDSTGDDFNAGGMTIGCTVIPSEDGTGRFRRGISHENLKRSIIGFNYVRGSTWYNYQLAGTCDYSNIGPNIAICDIGATDKSGAAWSPTRTNYIVYLGSTTTLKEINLHNCVAVCETAAMHGFLIQGVNGTVSNNATIRGGKVVAEVDMGSSYSGLLAEDISGTVIADGLEAMGEFAYGANFLNVDEVIAQNCMIDGATTFAMSASNGCDYVTYKNSVARNCTAGFQAGVGTQGLLSGLVTDRVTGSEIVLLGTSATFVVRDCTDMDGSGTITDSGTSNSKIFTNNRGFTSDQRVSATEITSKTSKTNTWGKHGGLLVTDANNVTWVASGSDATDTWTKVVDGTTTTPA